MRLARILPAIALVAICACRPETPAQVTPSLDLAIATDQPFYVQGQNVGVTLTNQSGSAVHVWSVCPPALEKQEYGSWVRVQFLMVCAQVPPSTLEVASGESTSRTIPNDARYGILQAGLYRIPFEVALAPQRAGEVFYSNEFAVVVP